MSFSNQHFLEIIKIIKNIKKWEKNRKELKRNHHRNGQILKSSPSDPDILSHSSATTMLGCHGMCWKPGSAFCCQKKNCFETLKSFLQSQKSFNLAGFMYKPTVRSQTIEFKIKKSKNIPMKHQVSEKKSAKLLHPGKLTC